MKTDRRGAFIAFIIFTLLTGWIGWGVDRLMGLDSTTFETPGILIWIAGPLVAAIIYWLVTKRFFVGLKPNLREGWPWWIAAAVVFPIVTLIVVAIARAFGTVDLSTFTLAGVASAAAATFGAEFVKNIFEEFVWRGVLVAELVKRNMSDWMIYLISGGVWALWHVPYYLAFLSLADVHAVLPVSRGVITVLALFTMMGWGILFTEIYRLAGSIWPAVILHTVEDAVVTTQLLNGAISFTSTTGALLFSPSMGIVTTFDVCVDRACASSGAHQSRSSKASRLEPARPRGRDKSYATSSN